MTSLLPSRTGQLYPNHILGRVPCLYYLSNHAQEFLGQAVAGPSQELAVDHANHLPTQLIQLQCPGIFPGTFEFIRTDVGMQPDFHSCGLSCLQQQGRFLSSKQVLDDFKNLP